MKDNISGVDGPGVIPLQVMCLVLWWGGCLSTTHSRWKRRGHLVMPPTVTGLFVKGVEVGGVGKAEVAATPMIHAPQ